MKVEIIFRNERKWKDVTLKTPFTALWAKFAKLVPLTDIRPISRSSNRATKMSMALPILVWFILNTTNIGLVEARNSSSLDKKTIVASKRFLKRHGVGEFDEVIYFRRTEHISECFNLPDARARAVQICLAISAYFECQNATDVPVFSDCHERQCVGRISPAVSICTIQRFGYTYKKGKTEDGWACGLPVSDQHLFEWNYPTWAQLVGSVESIGCMFALPKGSSLENRVVCDGTEPSIEYKFVFPRNEFPHSDRGKVHCLIEFACGREDQFGSGIVCFTRTEKSDTHHLVVQPQDIDTDDENGMSTISFEFSFFNSRAILIALIILHYLIIG